MKKIRVLVIDDSLFMRKMISDVLNADEDIEVIAEAIDGQDGLQKIATFKPDVVTLDYEMPVLNGIATLKKIMRHTPTPVIMVSAHTRKSGQITLSALHEGAIDYVLKPSGSLSLDIATVGDEIVSRVKVASAVDIKRLLQFLSEKATFVDLPSALPTSSAVFIGSSTGGVIGVERILTSLPSDFPAPIFLIQHLPELFVESFADRLNDKTELTVRIAEDGMHVKNGVVYVAPGGYHTEIACAITGMSCPEGEAYIRLTESPVVCGYRPSISVLMKSAAPVYRTHAIGILLSGMGVDGVDGLETIAQHGGKTIVQDEESSVVFGMGSAAVEIGAVDEILPIEKMPERIVKLLTATR
jgi:two-component system, chemotaxis family, protein-glutamate methylesterase/glutaminase